MIDSNIFPKEGISMICKNSDLTCQTLSDFDDLDMAGGVRTSAVL
jgi:hypothetical protein